MLKRNLCFDVSKTQGTTWWVILYYKIYHLVLALWHGMAAVEVLDKELLRGCVEFPTYLALVNAGLWPMLWKRGKCSWDSWLSRYRSLFKLYRVNNHVLPYLFLTSKQKLWFSILKFSIDWNSTFILMSTKPRQQPDWSPCTYLSFSLRPSCNTARDWSRAGCCSGGWPRPGCSPGWSSRKRCSRTCLCGVRGGGSPGPRTGSPFAAHSLSGCRLDSFLRLPLKWLKKWSSDDTRKGCLLGNICWCWKFDIKMGLGFEPQPGAIL